MDLDPIKNPYSEESWQGQSEQGFEQLPGKLEKYSKAKKRSSDMANYILENHEHERHLSNRVKHCGDWLVFRHYHTVDEVRLHSADFCKKHTLCPFCAIRRGGKAIQAYLPKVEQVLEKNKKAKLYMVTLTVKDGPDLKERFNHLTGSLKKLTQKRRNYFQNPEKRPYTEFVKALGGVYSIEIKRGKNSGDWHPHMHMIWICDDEPNQMRLSEEWKAITGDSFIVDARPMTTQENAVSGFMEVFKYALKFTDMTLEDNWTAFEQLKGKRLVNPFGELRGIKIPDELTDPVLDLPYIELFYNYVSGAGYSLCKTERSEDSWSYEDYTN